MEQRDLEAVEERLTTILLGWGAASTVVGSALWLAGWRSRRRALLRFGRQTALWGATDAAIALAGARDRRRRGSLSDEETAVQARRLLIILGINTAADVVYVAGGARVWSRASAVTSAGDPDRDEPNGDTYLGMGRADGLAIVIQGGFLLVLDAVFAHRLRRTLHRPSPRGGRPDTPE